MAIGKIRNLGSSSGGGIKNLLNTSIWHTTDATLHKPYISDNTLYLGRTQWTSSTPYIATILSDYFKLNESDILALQGALYAGSSTDAGVKIGVKMELLDANNNVVETLGQKTSYGSSSSEVALSFAKNGFKGKYRLKVYCWHDGSRTFPNYVKLTEAMIY